MVSLSSPLWQVREGSQGLHLQTGAGSRKVTHLQARSPRALATVQSRPVALRPMVPTTVSLTYCLDREEGGEVPFLVLFQGSGGWCNQCTGVQVQPLSYTAGLRDRQKDGSVWKGLAMQTGSPESMRERGLVEQT